MGAMKLDKVTLASVSRGAAPQLFEYEFNRVLKNIQDPNTDPEEERSITLVVRFKPAKSREEAMTRVQVKSVKLACARAVDGHMFMGREDGTDSKSPIIAVCQDAKQEVIEFEDVPPQASPPTDSPESEPQRAEPDVHPLHRNAAGDS